MTEVIAPDRPPDRIMYGEWEPDFESKKTRTFLQATRQSFFKVLEYEQVERTDMRYRRKVTEVWHIPAHTAWDVVEGVTDGEATQNFYPVITPPQTIARFWRWEYEGEDDWDDIRRRT